MHPQIGERAFQQHILQVAKLNRLDVFCVMDTRTPAVRTYRGWPDLVVFMPTGLVFAELKKEKGRTSAYQKQCLSWLHSRGYTACLWRPSMWRDICDFLEGREPRPPGQGEELPDDRD